MPLEVFRGAELRSVMDQVRRAMGDEAMMLQTRASSRAGVVVHEILAARADWVEAFLERATAGPVARRPRDRSGPLVIGLVGPAGAGKTTAAIRLALHPRGLATQRIGLVTLDTHRPGAVEELRTYAELADLPFEVAYHPGEVPGIRDRMREVDVVIVDTPGRSFGPPGSGDWLETLRAFRADEVHLAVPGGLRDEVARALRTRFAACRPTHALYTRLDEVVDGESMIDLVDQIALPARWTSEGAEIPGHLGLASARLLSWGTGVIEAHGAHGAHEPTTALAV